MYIYIYIYIKRERERVRDLDKKQRDYTSIPASLTTYTQLSFIYFIYICFVQLPRSNALFLLAWGEKKKFHKKKEKSPDESEKIWILASTAQSLLQLFSSMEEEEEDGHTVEVCVDCN